jgi:hypothetical protein
MDETEKFDPLEVRARLADSTDAELVFAVVGGLNVARHGASGKVRWQLDRVVVGLDVVLERLAPEEFADALALMAEYDT